MQYRSSTWGKLVSGFHDKLDKPAHNTTLHFQHSYSKLLWDRAQVNQQYIGKVSTTILR